MSQKQHLPSLLEKLKEYHSPKILGGVNDQFIKIAKIKGHEIPWHNHENEDELFLIIQGSLLMEIEGKAPFEMVEGDMFVVPKGVNHRVSSELECSILLIESKTTAHTGKVKSPITKSISEQYL